MPAAAIIPGCRFHGDRADMKSSEAVKGCGSGLLRHQSGPQRPSPNRCGRFKHPLAVVRQGEIYRVVRKQLQEQGRASVLRSETTPFYTIHRFLLIISHKSRCERYAPKCCWHGDR